MQLELWRDARLYLERLLQIEAKTSDAHYYLGRIAEQQGDCDRALNHYVKVGQGERRFDAQLRAAVCMAELDRLEEARLHLERMRSRYDKEDAVTQIVTTWGEVERIAGNAERALGIASDALETYPENDDLRYVRALAAARLDRFELARSDLEAIVERNPDDPRALNALGYMLADRKIELDRARSLIERALEQNTDDPATLDSMGWVLYRQGNNEQALEYLRRAWAGQKDPEIAAHLGEVLWVLGKREEARRIWERGRQQEAGNEAIVETIERLTQ
jgi:Flp pilus assembly protein TadD